LTISKVLEIQVRLWSSVEQWTVSTLPPMSFAAWRGRCLTYKPWKNDPFDPALALRRNTRWIQDKMRDGYHVIDIGPDLSRADPFGPFYGVESE
jgi:hypothetical protein